MQICRRLAVLVLSAAGQMGAAGRVDDGMGAMAEAAQVAGDLGLSAAWNGKLWAYDGERCAGG